MKKIVRECIYEKFKEEGDPIHDMGIGPQGIVYRCEECGSLLDTHNDILPEGEEFEKAKIILQTFGDNSDRVKYAWCNDCQYEEMKRQEREDYAREQQRQWEKQQEEEQRWNAENDRYGY